MNRELMLGKNAPYGGPMKSWCEAAESVWIRRTLEFSILLMASVGRGLLLEPANQTIGLGMKSLNFSTYLMQTVLKANKFRCSDDMTSLILITLKCKYYK